MKKKLFIDTWGWVVIHNRQEPRHAEVKAFYRKFRLQMGMIYTTDYILDETLTLLFRRLPSRLAKEIVTYLDEATQKGYLSLEWITPERFETAKDLRLRFLDKPTISFTDLTSMAVMAELKIESILTADAHFEQVGMGFAKDP